MSTKAKGVKDRRVWFEIYRQGGRAAWRWRAVMPNGRIVACSGEAFTRRRDSRRSIERLCEAVSFGACGEDLRLQPDAIRYV